MGCTYKLLNWLSDASHRSPVSIVALANGKSVLPQCCNFSLSSVATLWFIEALSIFSSQINQASAPRVISGYKFLCCGFLEIKMLISVLSLFWSHSLHILFVDFTETNVHNSLRFLRALHMFHNDPSCHLHTTSSVFSFVSALLAQPLVGRIHLLLTHVHRGAAISDGRICAITPVSRSIFR